MKYLLTTLCILVTITLKAQQVYVENGKMVTNFKFTSSSGARFDYLKEATNTIGFGFRAPSFSTQNKLHIGAGVHFNRYAASGTNLGNRQTYDWDVSYLSLVGNLEYDLLRVRGFDLFIKGQVSSEFFLLGVQTINGNFYNLKGEEQFDGAKIFIRGGMGASYKVNRFVSAYVQYLVGRNYFNIGEDKSDGQDLDISTHGVSLGIRLSLQDFTQFK